MSNTNKFRELIALKADRIKNGISNLIRYLTDSLRIAIDWLAWNFPKPFTLLQRAIEEVVHFVQGDRYFVVKALIDITIIFIFGSNH